MYVGGCVVRMVLRGSLDETREYGDGACRGANVNAFPPFCFQCTAPTERPSTPLRIAVALLAHWVLAKTKVWPHLLYQIVGINYPRHASHQYLHTSYVL